MLFFNVNQDSPVYEVFQKENGEKLNEESQSQIDSAEKEKHKSHKLPVYDNCCESNFASLFAQITKLKTRLKMNLVNHVGTNFYLELKYPSCCAYLNFKK